MRHQHAQPDVPAWGLGPRQGVAEDLGAGRLGQTSGRERLGSRGKLTIGRQEEEIPRRQLQADIDIYRGASRRRVHGEP